MAALPYIQLYVADYLADTQHLTLEEHGAYLLLIMNYWQRGKAPADDDKRLSSICSTDVESWLNIRPAVAEFFEVKDGFWVHHRIEKDLKKVKDKQRQASEAGKASAAARAGNKGGGNGRSTDVGDSLERESNHTDTDTDTDKKNTPPTPPRGNRFQKPSFEEVKAYCEKRGKGIDPQAWLDHYTANGWKVGKNPMKDWKAAVRTWERNGDRRSPQSPGAQIRGPERRKEKCGTCQFLKYCNPPNPAKKEACNKYAEAA